ncbi:MAG TPA: lipid II flippase MurJ, partial [Acidimicrobiales bacterium]|nr:lipid II flippase MurJ [Acidimicrobiales bacterium]
LSAVLVPTFVDLFGRGEARRVDEVAGGLLSIALVGLGVVVLLGLVFAPQLARLLTAGVADAGVARQQEELATYLLRFFIPQVLLYAVGAVATAVLHARGRFALTAVAPIGNTVVLVVAMVVFRSLAGDRPTLDLSSGERLCLALGGTLGVAAFVAVPVVGAWSEGFRARLGLRRALADREVRGLLRLSGWAAVQHSGTAILLAAALVACGGVAGGVVAYQLAMVVFLAPYGILAQPIHTAVLPRLSAAAAAGDRDGLQGALRWAVDAMAVTTLPVAAALTALSLPVMGVLAFGEAAQGEGPELLGAALLGLAVGVPAYGGFLLLTRAAYSLGDSRTPALASLVSAVAGGTAMLIAGATAAGAARLVLVGVGHTGAYALGGLWLAHRLQPQVGTVLRSAHLRPLAGAAAMGLVAWAAMSAWSPDGRGLTLVALVVVGGLAMGGYVVALHWLGAVPTRGPEPATSPS